MPLFRAMLTLPHENPRLIATGKTLCPMYEDETPPNRTAAMDAARAPMWRLEKNTV